MPASGYWKQNTNSDYFDDPFRYMNEARPEKDILTAQNRQAAREIAARSMVLLKNERTGIAFKEVGHHCSDWPAGQITMRKCWAPGPYRAIIQKV